MPGVILEPKILVIHCSDTPTSPRWGPRDIDIWHAGRGFTREETAIAAFATAYPYVGYHAVITTDGLVTRTRSWDEMGVHCAGINHKSWGVCLIGKTQYTPAQWEALEELTRDRLHAKPGIKVRGHNAFNRGKKCPGFSVDRWLARQLEPEEAHVLVTD